MLLLITLASAASDWSGPRVLGGDPAPTPTLAAGLGASFLAGGNAGAYAGGLAERILFTAPTGELVAFTLEFGHARHALVDADAYFPAVTVPAGSLDGFRDYFAGNLGFRFEFPVGTPRPGAIRARPFLRVGVGAVYTSTLVEGPGFDGRIAMRSNRVWPAPTASTGADIRVLRWLTLAPHLGVEVQIDEDVAESTGGPTHVGVEWRFTPALDLHIHL
jgi:hypothetical protein